MPARIVVDTNLIISASFWGGPPKRLVEAVKAARVIMLTTQDVAGEYERVLKYEKFVPHLRRTQQRIDDLLTAYAQMTEMVEAGIVPEGAVTDAKDIIILAAAVGGNADAIISGDDDLLRLKQYQDIPIVGATDFLATLEIDDR